MSLSKVLSRGRFISPLAGFNKVFFYILIAILPILIYPLKVGDMTLNLRQIREIGFFSLAIISLAYLQKNIWLKLFLVWCVLNWWLNFFIPDKSYIGLVNILSATAIYAGLKYLIREKILNVSVLLNIFVFLCVFQFLWMIMQIFNYDPVFYAVDPRGNTLPLSYKLSPAGWSGNPTIMGIFFAMTAFLLLPKFMPIFLVIFFASAFILKNFTMMLCFFTAGLFYIANTYRTKKKWLLLLLVACIAAASLYIEKPNFDRLPIWKAIIQVSLKGNFILGGGVNFYENLVVVDKTQTVWREAHNDYLQIYLELGIIGLSLFLGFIVSKFVEFFKKRKTQKQVCIMAGLIAYLVSGISLFPMHLVQLSFTAIMLLACLEESYVAESACAVYT